MLNPIVLLRILILAVVGLLLLTAYVYRFAAFCQWATPSHYDLLFNDHFLRHTVKTVFHETKPSHIMFMGDIFSNQWISSGEFASRLDRFKWTTGQLPGDFLPTGFPLYNLSGNHDIGYGRDTTPVMVERWEKDFGLVNHQFVILADHPAAPKVVMLNTQNLDHSRYASVQEAAWKFLQQVSEEQWATHFTHPLLLFLHIPLYKPTGLCVDPPEINVNTRDEIIDQTMLSPWISRYILYCLRPTVILTGHDHEGCKTEHRVGPVEAKSIDMVALKQWCQADPHTLEAGIAPFEAALPVTVDNWAPTSDPLRTTSPESIRDLQELVVPEITVRSIMGDFNGNSGLFEIVAKQGPRQSLLLLVAALIIYPISGWGLRALITGHRHIKKQY
ncbi:hypothetical protein BJ085DRAFT_32606 [Dimargaris cristalligena]|uniref:Calcineurin-like phosphoesterase domain-containing protein n=1 Tax=Dimargaris cristalligena TaxID=215637 RepID=A0A4Q0A1B7_9FUNG|nr:hypothetical protein BJ085DRAFT_32606 [Dimargaris cristalligena]|eukprot:RKP39906.1 hypothetical protein BJ085DRAFT_32606 [Dimargaris cristalligena]